MMEHHKPRRCGACALWTLRLSALLLQDGIEHLHDEALLCLGQCAERYQVFEVQDGAPVQVARFDVCGSNDSGTGDCLNLSRTTDSLGRYVETRDALNGRTRFWYEANGNVAAIEDAKNVVTKASYNAIGQRSSVIDPNQGTWSFLYNALGELTSQTDARGIATTMTYDKGL